jgi:zinc protease
MIRGLLLAVVLSARLQGQAMPLPPSRTEAGGKRPAVPAARAAAPKEPGYPPLHPVEAPRLEKSQLPNGLKLYLVEDHELPVVEGLVAVRAGNVFDPADRPGLAFLTINLLRGGGTRGKPAGEWDEALDRLGARLDVVSSETTSGFSFTAPRESAGDVLKALRAMLVEPAFRLEKLEVAKALRRAFLMRRDESSNEAVLRHFQSAIHRPGAAYGRQETEAAIAQVQRSDITQFHSRYYVPANTVLAIQGDFDAAAMKASIEQLFGGWTVEQSSDAGIPKAEAAPPAAFAVKARNLLRVRFMLGRMLAGVPERDSAAWEVLVMVVGGMRRSRLAEHAKSPVPGDTVEIGADWMPKPGQAGLLTIGASCAEPAFSAILETIRSEIKRLAASPVTEEEVRWAKDAVLARLAGGADTRLKRLSAALATEWEGSAAGSLPQRQAAIAAVTRADLDRLARTLDPARFTIVAIGDAEDLQRRLQAFGRQATILEAAPAPKEKPEAVAPEPEAAERGRRLMARAQEASGGAARVAELNDAVRTALFENAAAAGGGRQVRTESWLMPGYFREEAAGGYTVYTNGAGGFVTDGIRSNPLGGALMEQVHAELFRFYPRLLRGGSVPGRTLFWVDGDAVEFREGKRSARLVFDDSGLPSEILYETTSTNGLPIAVEEVLEDFRAVGGLKMPFRIRILHNGQPAAVVTVQELKVNSGLKIEDIAKRQ